MAKRIQPYTFDQRKRMVEERRRAMQPLYQRWRSLEQLFMRGSMGGSGSDNTISQDVGDLASSLGFEPETVNMVLPNITIITESIMAQDPAIVIEPLGNEDDAGEAALVAQVIAKYCWKRANATEHLRDAATDMVHIGPGFIKVGWNFEEEEVDINPDERQEVLRNTIDVTRDMAIEAGSTDIPQVEEFEDAIDTTSMMVARDEPFVSYVSPYTILVPEDARRMEETRWVAEVIRKPIDELCIQLNKKPEDFCTVVGKRYPETGSEGTVENSAVQYAEVIEFYDMRAHMMSVFELNGEKDLYYGPIPWTHHLPPYVQLACFRRNPNDFWPFGQIDNIANIQESLTETNDRKQQNMYRSGNVVFVADDVMNETVEDAMASAEDNQIVKVRMDGSPMSDKFFVFERPALSAEVYNGIEQAKTDMANVLGLSDFARGMSGADRMSASAVGAVTGNDTLRAQGMSSTVEKAISEIIRRIILLCQDFMSEETSLRIAGPNGSKVIKVGPQAILGEFKYSVEGGSTRAVNPAQRQQRALQLLNVVVPSLANLGYDPEPFVRNALRDMGYDPDIQLKKLPPPPAAGEDPGMAGGAGLPAGPGPLPAGPAGGGAPLPDAASLPSMPAMPQPSGADGTLAAGEVPADLQALLDGLPANLQAAAGVTDEPLNNMLGGEALM